MIHKTTRSILSVLLAVLLLVTSTPLTPAFADGGGVSPQSESGEGLFAGGTGAANDPYQIATAEELWDFAELVNNKGETTANAILTADIDLNPGFTFKEDGSYSGPDEEEPHQWTPIGNSSRNSYRGTFNGAGHTISGLYIDSSRANDQGLFGYVSGTDGDNKGTVQNLSVSGTVSGFLYVGGIAGRNGGNVINCTFSGSVSGGSPVGGVVGDNRGSVENCYNTGTATGSDSPVGGVVGNNDGSVTNCYNTGTVRSTSNTSNVGGVGGVVGDNYGGRVENCYNTGTVNVSGNRSVGGVVGTNSSGNVKNCYNTGEVNGSGNSVGGVVGQNIISSGTVTGCYFLKTDKLNSELSGIGLGGSEPDETAVSDLDKLCEKFVNDTDWSISGILGRPVLKSNPQGGLGTDKSPYQISNADELKNFATAVNSENGNPAAHAVLMENINLEDVCSEETGTSWIPIGNSSRNSYRGTFDGDGHTISGLYIDSSDTDYQGLFGYVGTNGKIENLTVEGSITVTGTVTSGSYVGGVVGYNNGGTVTGCTFSGSGSVSGVGSVGGVVGNNDNSGSVENCYNTGTGSVSGFWSVGGVVGQNSGTNASVKNCHNTGTGTVTGDVEVGGVVGQNSGSVTNCYNTGGVSGSSFVGGVVGQNGEDGSASGSVTNCYNTGIVRGSYVGGIVGWNYDSVTNCYNTGTVTGTDEYVGGVVGWNSGSVENCYNTGTVTGTYDFVGGVVGYNHSGTVKNCYNTGTGTVTGTVDFVGGVVGQNFGGTVENCYNTGSVKGSGNSVGGVVGYNQSGSSVTTCYNTGTVSGSDHVGGVVGSNGSNGSVEKCHNTGKVSGRYVGGVVGSNSGTVENCYNTDSVSDGTTSGGVVGQNSGNVKNCYFLEVNDKLQGIGGGSGTSSNVEPKTAKDFHSGEVAYLLQGTQTTPVWGQSDLNTPDSWPTLTALDNSAQPVYKVTVVYGDYADAPETETSYTNNPAEPSETPSCEGYTFDSWDKTGEGTTTITYTAKWTAEEPPYTGKYSYEITTDTSDNGSLTVDRYATEGDKVTIDVTPDQAYKLDDLSVTANGKEVELTANSDGTYSFTMPSADVKITATFAEDPDWTPDEPEEPTTDVSDLFIDIAPDAWYKDAIQYAYDNGLMTGVSDTEFAPEATTTRAMIVSILARLENVTTAQAAGFADVDDNDWYATAVNWAANVGVVNGYEDGTFKPNTAITREQLAAILMNYAAYKGEDVSNRADLTSYTDQPSTWAQEAMQWAVAEGLITGVTNTELQPQGNATRAQVAAILQRFLSE